MRIGPIFFVAFVFAVPTSLGQADSWNQHRFDETHQGFVPSAINKVFGTPTVEWWANRSVPATVKASPIYAEGKIFVGAWDNFLYALDSESGSELWKFDAKGKISGTAAASQSTVYVVTESGTLYAINAKTGVSERSVSVGATFGTPAVHERRVFIGNSAGKFSAYEGDTLTLIWTFDLMKFRTTTGLYVNLTSGGEIHGAPAIYNGQVMFGSTNQVFYSIDEQGLGDKTTRAYWMFDAGGAIRGSPAVDKANSRVLFGAQDGKLYSVGITSTGWQSTTWTHAQIAGPSLPSQIQSSPAIAYGNAYFGANNGNIVAVSLSTGQEVWKKTTGGQVVSSPAVANHTVVVGSSDRSLYVLNATTGAVLWTRPASSAIEASPAIHGTQVFWASTDGGLFSWGGPKPARADLTILSVTGSLLTGQSGSISATVKNTGSLASAATDVQFFTVDAKGATKLISTEELGALEPGAQKKVTTAYAPSGTTVTIRAQVDTANQIRELDEGNNLKDQKLTISQPSTESPTGSDGGAPGLGLGLILLLVAAVALTRRRRA